MPKMTFYYNWYMKKVVVANDITGILETVQVSTIHPWIKNVKEIPSFPKYGF